MNDLYLKFETQQQANDLLFDAVENPDLLDENSNPVVHMVPRWRNVDVIGVIYAPTGRILNRYSKYKDPEPEIAPIDGWHVNVRLMDDEDAAPLEPYKIDPPATPSRVWA